MSNDIDNHGINTMYMSYPRQKLMSKDDFENQYPGNERKKNIVWKKNLINIFSIENLSLIRTESTQPFDS